ncbi:hypothetical protein WSM22_16280 [Cytophagales bacterium WSM2-2]|nr:hypothetical protein WSM22_16280 [Cytophagales bacterium WSM2-2]
MTFRIILSLAILATNLAYSQSKAFILKGTLKEVGSSNTIPYANIWVTNSTQGTATDASGNFLISVGEIHAKEKIKISSIGYKTRFYSIDSLKNYNSVVLQLESDVSLLDEVVIRTAPVNPAEIVQEAIASIDKNYLNAPFNIEYYSEMTASDISSGKVFSLETILTGYSSGYSSGKRIIFKIPQKRATGDNHLKAIDYNYWPTFEIHNVDQISNAFKHGILNLKHLDKFSMKYSGVSLFDEDTVFTIEYYAPKPTKEITGYGVVPKVYKGSISITTGTHAIVKHEITTDQFSYSIIYKKWEEKYFPYWIYGERRTRATVLLSKITNSITLKSIETKNVKVIEGKVNEFDDINTVKYDEVYWNTFFPKEEK